MYVCERARKVFKEQHGNRQERANLSYSANKGYLLHAEGQFMSFCCLSWSVLQSDLLVLMKSSQK